MESLKDRAFSPVAPSWEALKELSSLYQIIKYVALTLAVFVLLKASLLDSFYVPSISMAPTLESDDCILVPKFAYGLHLPFLERQVVSWSTPQRGNVVVFRRGDDPLTRVDEGGRAMVKRVIGIPGDSISIQGTVVSVNGKIVDERYARWTQGGVPRAQSFSVPQGALFLLGDNRDESYDSRFWPDPFVKSDSVIGPVAAVYWSDRQPGRAGTLIR